MMSTKAEALEAPRFGCNCLGRVALDEPVFIFVLKTSSHQRRCFDGLIWLSTLEVHW